mgnify:CR=1 FL=1
MGRALLRDLATGAPIERVTATGIEGVSRYWYVSDSPNGIATLSGVAPEMRSVETDQSDPAGRYRWIGTGDSYSLQRALTAAWATSQEIFIYDHSGGNVTITNRVQSDTTGSILIFAGRQSTPMIYGGHMNLYGHGHTTYPGGVVFATSTANGQSEGVALQLTGATATPQALFPVGSVSLPGISFLGDPDTGFYNDNAGSIFVVSNGALRATFQSHVVSTGAAEFTNAKAAASIQSAIFEGDRASPAANDEAYITYRLSDSAGNQDEQVRFTWKATTITDGATQDADAIYSVLINNTLTEMLRLKGEDTGVNITVSANVPTTSTLAAGQIRYMVTAGDVLTAYYNKAGAIRSLTIGTLV